jgi:hypothetical protein
MADVFISYRRSTDAAWADTLEGHLKRKLCGRRVYLDRTNPVPGDWRRSIDEHLSECTVLLVVIGKGWSKIEDENGQVRLHQQDDMVRYEIVKALASYVLNRKQEYFNTSGSLQ